MTSTHPLTRQLITGERMTREEFLRVWDELPDVKFAELIDGVVFVPSPVSYGHGEFEGLVSAWLGRYAWATPGCVAGSNCTWLMLESAPQPDAWLRILPEFGGQSKVEGRFGTGAPELAVEVCVTSREVDFGPKLALYQRAGVREYITLETLPPKRIVWRRLFEGSYEELAPEADGVMRSRVFPGLWLDPKALWSRDGAALGAVVDRGLADASHAGFVEGLRSRRTPAVE